MFGADFMAISSLDDTEQEGFGSCSPGEKFRRTLAWCVLGTSRVAVEVLPLALDRLPSASDLLPSAAAAV